MENPFKKLIEENKIKYPAKVGLDNDFKTGFYCHNEFGTIVFIDKNKEVSNLLWRTSLGELSLSNEIICSQFMPITLHMLKRNDENLREDLKFIIMNNAYHSFLEFFKEKEEYDILSHIHKIEKTIQL